MTQYSLDPQLPFH